MAGGRRARNMMMAISGAAVILGVGILVAAVVFQGAAMDLIDELDWAKRRETLAPTQWPGISAPSPYSIAREDRTTIRRRGAIQDPGIVDDSFAPVSLPPEAELCDPECEKAEAQDLVVMIAIGVMTFGIVVAVCSACGWFGAFAMKTRPTKIFLYFTCAMIGIELALTMLMLVVSLELAGMQQYLDKATKWYEDKLTKEVAAEYGSPETFKEFLQTNRWALLGLSMLLFVCTIMALWYAYRVKDWIIKDKSAATKGQPIAEIGAIAGVGPSPGGTTPADGGVTPRQEVSAEQEQRIRELHGLFPEMQTETLRLLLERNSYNVEASAEEVFRHKENLELEINGGEDMKSADWHSKEHTHKHRPRDENGNIIHKHRHRKPKPIKEQPAAPKALAERCDIDIEPKKLLPPVDTENEVVVAQNGDRHLVPVAQNGDHHIVPAQNGDHDVVPPQNGTDTVPTLPVL